MQPSIELDKNALEFLQLISVNFRPNTVSSYRSSLRLFQRHLSDNGKKIQTVNRKDIEQWLMALKDRELAPITRSIRLLWVRTYLRWLKERELLDQDPERLIRNNDFPKLPEKLPRPLPPRIDRELQNRLQTSKIRHLKAFLVMRKTGIRIGELSALSFDCLKEDSKRQFFLKVPLGKLHNERIVPVDKTTVELIQEIQNQGRVPRTFLVANPFNTQITSYALRFQFQKVVTDLERLDSQSITPHRLRHTYATELLNAGMYIIHSS
jgi:site-specific recombinase XerD